MNDSTQETREHILRVRELLYIVQNKLEDRGFKHDLSKLQEPEKSAFDLASTKLKEVTYGSDEYKASLNELGPALNHHYSVNRHHPEYHANGIRDMSLLDLIEMLMDWKAGTERMKNGGDIRKSLEINTARFRISDQLVGVLAKTIEEMDW